MQSADSNQVRFWSSYAVLLAMLLLLLALHPFAGVAPALKTVLRIAGAVMLAAGLRAIWTHRRTAVVATVLAVAVVIVTNAAELTDETSLASTGQMLRFLVYAVLITSIASDLLRSSSVTMNTIFGASCVYLLMGLAWASVFAALESTYPGSYRFPDTEGFGWVEQFGTMSKESLLVYYSMITLTTVGYGDIIPLSPPARLLAAVEGAIGQLYLAIVIARFVGLEIAARIGNRN